VPDRTTLRILAAADMTRRIWRRLGSEHPAFVSYVREEAVEDVDDGDAVRWAGFWLHEWPRGGLDIDVNSAGGMIPMSMYLGRTRPAAASRLTGLILDARRNDPARKARRSQAASDAWMVFRDVVLPAAASVVPALLSRGASPSDTMDDGEGG